MNITQNCGLILNARLHLAKALVPCCLLLGILQLPLVSQAQTTISIGDIQVLGVTSDAADSFSFVLWNDISSGTVISFRDSSFANTTSTMVSNENSMTITFDQAVSAGSVIGFSNATPSVATLNGGSLTATISGALSGISNSGDQVFAYQGNNTSSTDFSPATLLYGFNIANTDWIATGTADSNKSYLPDAINFTDANFDSGNFDNADYAGTRSGLTTATYRAAISNIENYTQNDARFDLGTTAFSISGTTNLHWDANGTTAGNGGSGTWDTTTQSRFKNGSAGTTYLRWVNSTTGNDHTAVFGGTAGTVDVAASGVTASGLQFDTTGYTLSGNTITLSGASTPVIATGANNASISALLAGIQGFTKTGSGTLTLSGTNNYSGDTTVSEGIILVNGDQSAATGNVTVSPGTTLGGIGTIGGDTTITGTLSTGSSAATGSVGTLTWAGSGTDLTFASGSSWLIDLVEGISPSSDRMTVGGSLFIDPTASITFTDTGDYTTGNSFTLASYSNRSGFFSNYASSGNYVIGGNNYYLDYGSTTITLTATPVPEPITFVPLGVVLAAGAWYYRRRTRPATPVFGV